MATKKDISSPKKGMNRDVHESELGKTEYSFALNTNFTSEYGTGQILLQNEPSNYYCSGFKVGYVVIGHKYDVNNEKIYFFLTNPVTGAGEIGYIDASFNADNVEAVEQSCGCNIKVILENPLEGTLQDAICEYNTIIDDTCTLADPDTIGTFNFNKNYPIHESNIQIKKERLGTTIYWTDNLNPPRYIKLNEQGSEADPSYTEDIDCQTGVSTPKCISADELRVFRLFNKPCLEVETLTDGGVLRAGMYEVLIAYCNMSGDAMSQYYSMTNPLAIHDRNNNILDQTNLDYITNKGFRIAISDLDEKYEFFKIAVIYRSGLDAAVRYFNYNVYTTDTTSLVISSLADKTPLTLPELLSTKPTIELSKGMANANGYLFQYGIKEQREINLQPVINLLGSLATWSTVQAKEDLFEDGANVSTYRHYMRDEVQPIGIKFLLDGGFETAIFPFIPRPAFAEPILVPVEGQTSVPVASELDLYVVDGVAQNINAESVLRFNPECSSNERIYKWQFENTAAVLGDSDCTAVGASTREESRVSELSCIIDSTLSTATPETIEYVSELDLTEYINTYRDTIRAYTGTDAGMLSIKDAILAAEESASSCTPDLGELSCDPLTLVTDLDKTYAVVTGTPTVIESEAEANPSDYTRVKTPDSSNHIVLDIVTGDPAQDTALIKYIKPFGSIYKRSTVNNTISAKAKELRKFSEPQLDDPNHLLNKIATSTAAFANADGVVATAVSANYLAYLHSNVIWYKATFAEGETKIQVELSPTNCEYADLNNGTELRVSFYNNPATPATPPVDTVHITDLGVYTEAKNYYTLDIADYPSGTAYIAIDSPFSGVNVVAYKYGVTGTTSGSGIADITVGGIVYEWTINTDNRDETARDITANKAILLQEDWGILMSKEGASAEIVFYVPTSAGVTMDGGSFQNTTFFGATSYYSLKPPCGCFNIVKRTIEKLRIVSFTNLTFGLLQTYTTSCLYNIPILNSCDVIPHKKGLFSYWESTEDYPCNDELYNSINIKVHPDDFSIAAERSMFIEYYVTKDAFNDPIVDVDGYYVLSDQATFTNKKIRHYKFPDNKVIPFMNTAENSQGDFKNSIIYPIGFTISPSNINAFLDIALRNNLITAEERSKINKYEIYRGDRRVNKSVIAKGLLFDMFSENNNNFSLYSNYPLNSLGHDSMNGNVQDQWYNSSKNVNYTFHSPNTHFYNPTLPRELAIDGYVYGKSRMYFDTVDKHPEYTILANGSFILATTLGVAEAALELFSKAGEWTVLGGTGGMSAAISVPAAIAAGFTLAASSVFNAGKYRLQWIQSLYDLGHPMNHAYYQVAVGHYNYFTPTIEPTNHLRGLSISHYLKEGLWTVSDEYSASSYKVNNRDREHSVFLSLNDEGDGYFGINYPAEYVNYDNTYVNPNNATRRGYSGKGKSPEIVGNAASPYVTLKQYSPAQYGSLNSINWLSTGYCGRTSTTDADCEVVFGGDTFISRFAVKRKFPFFSSTAFGLAPLTPFIYSYYWNINPGVDSSGRYYLNYKLIDEEIDEVGLAGLFFPSQRSQYRLQYEQTGTHLYVNSEAKFYLYSYGFPYFLVESEFNCNFRYAGREMSENFYPNTGDIISYTQEKNVPIRELERFNYNTVYSSVQSKTNWRTMPNNYSREVYDKLAYSNNGVIISKQDNTEISLTDPWLVYDGLEAYDFPTDYGQLIDMDAIESGTILARFTNGTTMFETDDKVLQKLIGQSKSFNKTDLGYAGSQNKAKVSCEFGHYWVDAKRGKVFTITPGGGGLSDITDGLEKWLKENLPFQILKKVPEADIDNAYNGIGLTMGWDDRMKRVFVTKKDFRVKNVPIEVRYSKEEGYYYLGEGNVIVNVELTDTTIFEECSWTAAYSPLTKSWVSYYSFKPNYYIGLTDYFQTGINYSTNASQLGLWSHLPFLSSYQVYYGTLYPFTVEFAVPSKYSNSIMQSIEYMLDVRKYYDKYDYADIYGIGFNQAIVYNNHQNSGLLNLHHQKENDARQLINYPKHNNNSIDILQSCIDNKWSFNYLYNLIRSDRSGLPVWNFDISQVEKVIDHRLLDYRPTFKDRLRGSYFKVQLSNTLESRYKFIFQYAIDERNYYEQ